MLSRHCIGLLCCMLLAGCAGAKTLRKGRDISCRLLDEPGKLIQKLGYGATTLSVSRSSTGDRLFVQFRDASHVSRVAIVSSDNVRVVELPGQSRLNDQERPVFWINDAKAIQFASGYTLPKNMHTRNFISDGRFVALYDSNHLWIARVESPLDEVLVIPSHLFFEKLFSSGNKLYIFAAGQPEGNPRRDRRNVLKKYEYDIGSGSSKLLGVQDFDFTVSLSDFDPATNQMLARSLGDMFTHGWLVDATTGRRDAVSGLCEIFLEEGVVRRLRSKIQER